MIKSLRVPNGELRFPLFLPDATRGVVRAIDSRDLEDCGIEALMMNSFHLMQKPGVSTVKALGGLHRMSGWNRPIVTDSGGFQIYSLLRQNQKLGNLSNKGAIFQTDPAAKKIHLTPEKAIQLQMSFGADIAYCLDDCTHPDDPSAAQRESVDRTVLWAQRSMLEFRRLVAEKKLSTSERPLLFAAIQGGSDPQLRRECAEKLLALGFDGYGYGGWPLDSEGNFLTAVFAYTRELIPAQYPMHALGVGHPANIVQSFRLGYQIFDSAMPTRDARHGRLYCFTNDAGQISGDPADWFAYLYIHDKKHIKSDEPVCAHTPCPACERYSRGYLHHLFAINDALAARLATIHNLWFMTRLINSLRNIDDGHGT